MISFPLVNLRKNPDGSWSQSYATETITVPDSSPYVVRLSEVPDNGSVNSKPYISELALTVNVPPEPNEYYVNYLTGDVIFNAAQKNNTYNIAYWKRGTLVDADHLNFLYDRIIKENTAPPELFNGETGTLYLNQITKNAYIYIDGWYNITNPELNIATQESDGLMSKEDKLKLDTIFTISEDWGII
jgi:hypothetical protein